MLTPEKTVLFFGVKMKMERVMGIEPTCQVKIEEVVL